MEAINYVRVMLFWDSEIARDAYGLYFTGVVRKKNIKIPRYESQSLECPNDNEGAFILRKMRYLWTIPPHLAKVGIHILVKFEHIQQQNIPIPHDTNTTTLPEHITAVTHMVSDEPSMLYSTVNNDDDEVDGSDRDDVVSSQSESDDDNDPEEGEFQTPQNPEILSTR
ncbi:hypothetical protein M9H77_03511 [Catharanthus roseus]|uniref:Uncharacterized protein n=1 Tax=Catharanthus roseus TaxID=4058 RepID=A0ACC0CBC7_CATRO|nr:hypothetical protein M9H77_03511 [Catharanthus roseus]